MTWQAVSVLSAIVLGLLSAALTVFGWVRNERRAAATRQEANSASLLSLGTKDLVDQYQEANSSLRDEVRECKGKCAELDVEVRHLREDVQRVTGENGRLLRELAGCVAERDRLQNLLGDQ